MPPTAPIEPSADTALLPGPAGAHRPSDAELPRRRRVRVALGLRAQLALVLTVLVVLPWLGFEYVRELEQLLRDAQERTLAGTAEAVATALHERPRLFDVRTPPAAPAASATPTAQAVYATPANSAERRAGAEVPAPTSPLTLTPNATPESNAVPAEGAAAVAEAPPHPGPEAEVAQILRGLSRTSARIFVIDRNLAVLARAGTLKTVIVEEPPASGAAALWAWFERSALQPIYGLVLAAPTEDFGEDDVARTLGDAREVQRALAGIPATERHATRDGRVVIVTAAHPVWVGDQVRGAVLVAATTNRVLLERNRAFERLFTIVLATLLVGVAAVTWFASRLSRRIGALRDDAGHAIDAQGRLAADPGERTRPLAGSDKDDEIGDLARSFGSAINRLAHYASYQQNMASRLSHELRTPIAVVRSSLENLRMNVTDGNARVYLERAQGGLNRLADILTRMTEATRLEQSLAQVERERFDLAALVPQCVEGYRLAYPTHRLLVALPEGPLSIDGAPDLVAQMLDKLIANATEFAAAGTPISIRVEGSGEGAVLAVENEGPSLPAGMHDRLFDSMVSVRPGHGGDVPPHLGLGLYIVRLIAEFHGGRVRAENRPDGAGVVVSVLLPLATDL